jgi:hypothetical protein
VTGFTAANTLMSVEGTWFRYFSGFHGSESDVVVVVLWFSAACRLVYVTDEFTRR